MRSGSSTLQSSSEKAGLDGTSGLLVVGIPPGFVLSGGLNAVVLESPTASVPFRAVDSSPVAAAAAVFVVASSF